MKAKIKVSSRTVEGLRRVWQSPLFFLFMVLWIFTLVPAFVMLIAGDGGPLVAFVLCMIVPASFLVAEIGLWAWGVLIPILKRIAGAIFEVTE